MKNIIRIIFLADTHLGFDMPIRPRIHRPRRGPDFFRNFDYILQYAVENKADMVIHGGDFFFRSKVPAKIIDLAYLRLNQFSQYNIPFVMVPGNHERGNMPPSLFLHSANIYVFDKPDNFQFHLNGVKIAFGGFPNIRDDVRPAFLSKLKKTGLELTQADVKFLLLHQAVDGATVGPANFTFKNHADVVNIRDIPGWLDAVLCGHIHRRQILHKKRFEPGKRVPIIYPGAIERTSFAEMREAKGFYDMTITKNVDGGNIEINPQFVKLSARPMDRLHLPEHLSENEIIRFLQLKIPRLPENSVIKILLFHLPGLNYTRIKAAVEQTRPDNMIVIWR